MSARAAQVNYTGPMMDNHALLTKLEHVRAVFGADPAASHVHALRALEIEGELPFRLCKLPELLVLGR